MWTFHDRYTINLPQPGLPKPKLCLWNTSLHEKAKNGKKILVVQWMFRVNQFIYKF